MLARTNTPLTRSLRTAASGVALAAAAFFAIPSTATAHNHGGYGDKAPVIESNQQTSGTIVSYLAGDENFTTLVSLVQGAGLVETLNSEGPFTVFAPTNKAFEKVPQEALQALGNNPDLLRDTLLYHVTTGAVGSSTVVNVNNVKTVQGASAGVEVKDGKVYVDGAKVVATDIRGSNGVVHVIDSVILPPNVKQALGGTKEAASEGYGDKKEAKTIVEIAAGNEDFETLVSLVKAAGLADTLASDGPFTVFAPTDAAFEKVPAEVLQKLADNPDMLRSVLLYHVVPGKVTASQVVTKNMVDTAEGTQARVTVMDNSVQIDSANVVTTDIMASNGVIHVIDSVILPNSVQVSLAE